MKTTSTNTVNEQAREWFVLMQSGSVTEAQRQQLHEWLAEDAQHRAAYREYEQVWQGLGELASSAGGSALRRSVAGVEVGGVTSRLWNGLGRLFDGSRKYALAAGCAVVVLGLGVWLLPVSNQVPAQLAMQYETAVGEVRTVTLADGSVVTMGAKSGIQVSLGKTERRVELTNGQAFFDVAKDSSRPFTVRAGNTLVRVVGTEFDVHKVGDEVRVSVAEGVVNVSAEAKAPQQPDKTVELTAGQQATRAANGELKVVDGVPLRSIGGWRNGRLVYQRARLVEVISDANRYFPGAIHLDPALDDLEVTAAFNTEQLESLPETLEAILPINVERKADNKVFILPSGASGR